MEETNQLKRNVKVMFCGMFDKLARKKFGQFGRVYRMEKFVWKQVLSDKPIKSTVGTKLFA